MRTPLLLRIDELGLDAWQVHENEVIRVAVFDSTAQPAFRAWLEERPTRAPCRLLVDLADEAYESEDIPRVRGADRRALITRRLAAWFPDPAYTRAIRLDDTSGQTTPGRERMLFSGLNQPATLQAWIDPLRATGRRVERIVTAAELLAHLHARAVGTRAQVMVLGRTRAGLRISLLMHGQALFSRIVGHSAAWQDELARTRNYLRAQHRVASKDALDALVIGTPEQFHTTAAVTEDDPSITFIPSERLGPNQMRDDTDAPTTADELAPLLLHALRRAPARLGWAAASAPRRPGGLLLGGGLLAACLALGAGYWLHAQAAARAGAEHSARPSPLEAVPAQPTHDAAPAPPDDLAPPPEPVATAAPQPPLPAAPTPAPAARVQVPEPKRIDGVLRRPDGRHTIWLDGKPIEPAQAGLRMVPGNEPALAPSGLSAPRLRVGDLWPAPATTAHDTSDEDARQ